MEDLRKHLDILLEDIKPLAGNNDKKKSENGGGYKCSLPGNPPKKWKTSERSGKCFLQTLQGKW